MAGLVAVGTLSSPRNSWPSRALRQRYQSTVFAQAKTAYPAAVVLDIEGTTTPISFVTDVLFPYAYNNVRGYLKSRFADSETQHDIQLIREQVHLDLEQGVPGAVPIPLDAGADDLIDAVVANVKVMIDADRKVFALKELQGHIWRMGFQSGELQSQVFDDVPLAMSEWKAAGTKVYIYSSGSREAQRMIFANTTHDLRPFLCGFFDTSVGAKQDPKSYREIFQTVGVDSPFNIVFATDVLAEAIAAKEAGLQTVILLRPGNKPLPSDHQGFRLITSLSQV